MQVNSGLRQVIQMHPNDNVLVALTDLVKETIVEYGNQTYQLKDDIKAKHKFYASDLLAGSAIIMYGVLIGKLQTNVLKGSLMTTENLKHASEPYSYKGRSYQWKAPDVSKYVNTTFNGFYQNDGQVGTANYWLFIPTVFCENRNLDIIKEALHNQLGYAVSDKYLRFTKELLAAYQKGEKLDSVQIALMPSPTTNRVFQNVDGIKFLSRYVSGLLINFSLHLGLQK